MNLRPLIALAFIGLSPDQASSQSAWIVALGLTRQDQADDLVSPLRYGGLSPALSIGWLHGDRTLTAVALEFDPGRLTSRASTSGSHGLSGWTGGLSAQWLRRVAGGERSRFYLGPRLGFFGSLRRHQLLADGPTELYADLIAGLEAAGAWSWTLTRTHALSQVVSTPIFSAALRTPYTGAKFMPPLMVGGPGRLLGIRYQADYVHQGSGRLALGGRYGFQAFHYPNPRSLSVVVHQLGVVLWFGDPGLP